MGHGFNRPEPGGADGKSNTWLTPRDVIEELGPFDLDPCAAPSPRPWDCARVNYESGGLEAEWKGFVWLNPPYGRQTNLMESFLMRLVTHDEGGIAFIFARTETHIFQDVVTWADALFFPEGRYVFCLPDGSAARGNAGAPSVFLAFGQEEVKRLHAYAKKRHGIWITSFEHT